MPSALLADSAYEIPLQRMERLSIIIAKGGVELHFNRVFRDGMVCALTGACV